MWVCDHKPGTRSVKNDIDSENGLWDNTRGKIQNFKKKLWFSLIDKRLILIIDI